MKECTMTDAPTIYKLENTGIWGEAVRQRRPIIINDFKVSHPLKKGYPEGHVPLRRFMTIPVLKEGRIVAVVGVANRIAEYTETDVEQLTVMMEFIWEIAERKRVEEVIRHIAFYDVLTGLPNRAHLNDHLNEVVKKARLNQSSCGILFVDMDDIMTVNNVFGHSCGDKVIIASATHLIAEVGDYAYVARVYGDKFIVILPDVNDRIKIGCIAKGIVATLNREYDIGDSSFHMSASVGIAIYPEDGDTAEEILKNADSALLSAKENGTNHWRFYETTMQEEAHSRMLLMRSLRYAIERGELSLHYQPQVNTAGIIVGFEALIRWDSLEYGCVSPVRFIPLAEASGLILPIGTWVLKKACQFARHLTDIGKESIVVAINISPNQLVADDFVALVCDAIDEAGILPCQIELEVTEGILLLSMEDSIRKLEHLKTMGVSLALDDFGTGYSSLTYLKRLPVGTLKIDKTFIDIIEEDLVQSAIIKSIIDMAHILNMKVVAEGVETKGQFEHITSCGCDLVQGYFFSRPVPEDEAIRILAAGNLLVIASVN